MQCSLFCVRVMLREVEFADKADFTWHTDPRAQCFVNTYFYPTWVNGDFRFGLLNFFGVEIRTNNVVESHHKKLGVQIPTSHPSLFAFINELKS
jgi:hypothetical protein